MATIAQILPSLHSGGVERGTIEIAYALVQAGHRALVISSGGAMVAELSDVGAEHITMPVAAKQPFTAFRRGAMLAQVLQQENIDLLHYRSRVPGWLSVMARRIVRKQGGNLSLLSTYHGMYPAQNRVKHYYNSVMVRADHTIAVSHTVADWIRAQYPNFDSRKMTIIPRGCNLSLFTARKHHDHPAWCAQYGLDASAPVLMQVGRLSSLKGAAFLAQALAQLADLPWQWVLVGEDSSYPEEVARIKRTLHAAGVADRVHFFGVRRDMAELYAHTDLLLSGAQQPEAFGRTIIEAAACSVPAIVPDYGGTAEVVVDGITGWHYGFRDSGDAARVLRCALSRDAAQRDEIGQAAQRRVLQQYRLESMQEATLQVYERLLGSV